jgi:cell division initiation protein
MKISPLEIRQKTFEKTFRGYDKDEVDAFLLSLSQEWERVMEESKDLKSKLTTSEAEVQKLREVESTLYKTLKTAEDTGANVVEQANRTAEQLMKESRLNSESMINEARTYSRNMVEEAEEKAKNILFQAQGKLSEIVSEVEVLQKQKQDTLLELRQFASELLEKVGNIPESTPFPDYVKTLEAEEEAVTAPVLSFENETSTPDIVEEKIEEISPEPVVEEDENILEAPKVEFPKVAAPEPKSESFFDQI